MSQLPKLTKTEKKKLTKFKAKIGRWRRENDAPWITLGWAAAFIGTVCLYCDEMLNMKNMSLDHRVPISRGGMKEKWNLWPITMQCNDRKGNFTEKEYKALLNFLDREMPHMKKNVLARLKQGWRASFFVKPQDKEPISSPLTEK